MSEHIPRVSIGLPVYNGDNYLRVAIDAVRAQTFQDWELVICDNCSTDTTEEICRAYAAQDPRIRYHRNERNIGGTPNHNLTVHMSRAKYYKSYAHDDALEPEFLARCVEVLDRDPGVVNCTTKTMIMDGNGDDIHPDPWHLRTDSPNPRIRFHDCVWVHHHCFQIYGLMRRELLLQTPLQGAYPSSDQVMLAEMSLYGRFFEVPELLFRCRRHEKQSVALSPEYLQGKKKRSRWFARPGVPPYSFNRPDAKRAISFHMWRVVREYAVMPWRTPASFATKLWCTANIACYAVANSHKLFRDLLIAVDQLRVQATTSNRPSPAKQEARP